ncbi:SDR family NAD(P)-dependent oxidoreductase [Variovorax sp. dw_308]|uniref:SDR family NAD(P)-dependent oxidoreductase n=1 Tax=Variovorax sp. dw_308 TaxID=2721546 RepID=UPI001C4676E2|nr:SDR family NAD(P)-dependent oxidoreductase [Variovorax sp. dw_308]
MSHNPRRLEGKRTIITAAASGMGKAGCELFAQHGARIAAIDRDEAALASVVAAIEASGGHARGFVADLSDSKATVDVIDAAKQWLEGVDILWNHAGMPAPADIDDLDLARYRLSAELNLTSAVLVSGEVIRTMRKQRSGSIVFTSSTSGLVGSALSPLYSALKAGVIGLTKGLAVRYAAEGIRVNTICPGPVATPMLYNDFMKVDPRFSKEDNEQRVLSAVPMGRVGQPLEVAHAALWLASDDASFVTGAALPIDGGLTAR